MYKVSWNEAMVSEVWISDFHAKGESCLLYFFLLLRFWARLVCNIGSALSFLRSQNHWVLHPLIYCPTPAPMREGPLNRIPQAPSMSHGPQLSIVLPPWLQKEKKIFQHSSHQRLRPWMHKSSQILPQTVNPLLPSESSYKSHLWNGNLKLRNRWMGFVDEHWMMALVVFLLTLFP